jgi:hypothetical protein
VPSQHRPRKDRGKTRLSKILATGKEAQQRPAPVSIVLANSTAQHWVASLERIQQRAQSGWELHLDDHLGGGTRQRA